MKSITIYIKYFAVIILFLMVTVSARAEHAINDADLELLDKELESVVKYDQLKYDRIDSLKTILHTNPYNAKERMRLALRIGKEYESFITDSAMVYYDMGLALAIRAGDNVSKIEARLYKMKVLGVSGFFKEASFELAEIEKNPIPESLKTLWCDAARQLYIYMLAYTEENDMYSQVYRDANNGYRDSLLASLDKNSYSYRFYTGETLISRGQYAKANMVLSSLIGELSSDNSDVYARATSAMALVRISQGLQDVGAHYWVLSAVSDIRNSIKENTSIQNLALYLYAKGDIDHAYKYIKVALEDANFCNARLRKMQISRNMPLIDRAYKKQIEDQRRMLLISLAGLSVLSIFLIVAIILGLKQMKKLNIARAHLNKANKIKEEYMGHFLDLCSIYMERLDNFCKVVTRKVSTGQLEDLIKMTKSNKFAEDQHKLFYENFDSAFLHIYPNFVTEFNDLLIPEERIEVKEYGKLTPELRIFAFLRMGVDDSNKIASFLHYSVNTIYAYRNRMKNKAKNRETFDDDIMKIGDPK